MQMTTQRTINGTKFNIANIVDDAISATNGMTLDLAQARQSLMHLGHQEPDDALVLRYARESAILANLTRATGANFGNQIGKIDFSNRERTVASVESYLNRRINGQHARWTANRK
jgi:hypothetical protein